MQASRQTGLGSAFAAAALGMVGDRGLLPWNTPIGQDVNYRAAVPTLADPGGATGVMNIL